MRGLNAACRQKCDGHIARYGACGRSSSHPTGQQFYNIPARVTHHAISRRSFRITIFPKGLAGACCRPLLFSAVYVRGVARMSRTSAAKKRLIISGGWRIHGVRRFALPGEPGVQKKRKRHCAQSKRALGAFIYRKESARCRSPPRFSCFFNSHFKKNGG